MLIHCLRYFQKPFLIAALCFAFGAEGLSQDTGTPTPSPTPNPTTQDRLERVGDKAAETIDAIREATAPALEDLKESGKRGAEKARQGAEVAGEKLKEAGNIAIERARTATEKGIENIKSDIAPATERARVAAERGLDSLKGDTTIALERTRDAATSAVQDVRSDVKNAAVRATENGDQPEASGTSTTVQTETEQSIQHAVTHQPPDSPHPSSTRDSTDTVDSDDEDTVTQNLRAEASALITAANEYGSVKSEEYRRKIDQELRELEPRINALRIKAEAAATQAGHELRRQVESLDRNTTEVKARLYDLGQKTDRAFEDIRAGIESAMEELRNSYDAARKSE